MERVETSWRDDQQVVEAQTALRSVEREIPVLTKTVAQSTTRVRDLRREFDGMDASLTPARVLERTKAKLDAERSTLATAEAALEDAERRRVNLQPIIAERIEGAKLRLAPAVLARYTERVREFHDAMAAARDRYVNLKAEAEIIRSDFETNSGLVNLGDGVDPTLLSLAGRGPAGGFDHLFLVASASLDRWIARAKHYGLLA
jgi:chromosome segregation ATPase